MMEVLKELDTVQNLHNISVQSLFILWKLSLFRFYTKYFGSWFCVFIHAEMGIYMICLNELVSVTAHCVLSIKSR